MESAPTITEIRPDPTDPNLRVIVVGDAAAATVREADIESLGLTPGLAWDASRAAAVRRAVEVLAARRAGLAILGRRGCSRSRLIELLGRRGHDPETAARAADELIDEGWLDEAAYARAVAAEIVRRQPATAALIEQRLRTRGIGADLARQVAEDLLSGQDPLAAALELARARSRPGRGDPRTTAGRVAGLLTRRGFDDDTIATVLDRLELVDVPE